MHYKKLALLAAGLLALSSMLGCSRQAVKKEAKDYLTELPAITEESLPAAFDLRDYGYITAVKNQGELGNCWAFAAIAAAESSILSELKTNVAVNSLDLSEHHLAYFAKTHLPSEGETGYDKANSQSGEGFYSQNALGGWGDGSDTRSTALAFASGIGVVLEETAPYKGKNGTVSESDDWSLDESLRFTHLYTLETGYMLPSPKADGDTLNDAGIKAIKEMLLRGRAVAVSYAYDAGTEEAESSSSSPYLNEKTYAHYTYEAVTPNHAVTIVGWDDSYPAGNFNSAHQPAGDGAWIVKNSWGAVTESGNNYCKWGVDGSGYFYLSYYDQSIDFPVAYDFDAGTEGGAYAVTQQYDLLGAFGSIYTADTRVMEANVFTAEQDMTLQAVGTMISAENVQASVEVYLLNDGAAGPTDGMLAASFTKTYRYMGYYREALEAPVTLSKGQRYSVVVTECTAGDKPTYYYQYADVAQGRESIIAMFTNAYYVGVVNPGESYLYREGKGWQDLTEYLKALEGDDPGMVAYDNFCIKAFGNTAEIPG